MQAGQGDEEILSCLQPFLPCFEYLTLNKVNECRMQEETGIFPETEEPYQPLAEDLWAPKRYFSTETILGGCNGTYG